MKNRFQYDVFLSHSSADKKKVRRLAERLQDSGYRVWFDEWVIQPGDPISIQIELGLQNSQTLVLLMSNASLGSDWVAVERHTAFFRDPVNRERRFIPILLEHCEDKIPDTLRMYKYLNLTRFTQKAYQGLISALGNPRPSTGDDGFEACDSAIVRTIHHLDDEPETIDWIPTALFNHFMLTNPSWCVAGDLTVDTSGRVMSFPLNTPSDRYIVAYRIYESTELLGKALRWRTVCDDVLLLDVMIEHEDGRFSNHGIEALSLATRVITPDRIFFLTAYSEFVPDDVSKMIPRENFLLKPPDPNELCDRLVQCLAIS